MYADVPSDALSRRDIQEHNLLQSCAEVNHVCCSTKHDSMRGVTLCAYFVFIVCFTLLLCLFLQDYIREMGACLIQLDSDKDSTTVAWLNTLVSEAMSLIAYRTKIVQPSMSPVMSEGVMTRTTEEPVTPPLDATYYQRVLVRHCRVLPCPA